MEEGRRKGDGGGGVGGDGVGTGSKLKLSPSVLGKSPGSKAVSGATYWWASAAENILVLVRSTSSRGQEGICNSIYDRILTISVLFGV